MLNEKEINIAWSVTDFFICFPFFVMGKWLKLSNNLNNECKLNAFFYKNFVKGKCVMWNNYTAIGFSICNIVHKWCGNRGYRRLW